MSTAEAAAALADSPADGAAVSASLHLAWVGEGSERAKVIDSVACIQSGRGSAGGLTTSVYGGSRLFGGRFPLSVSFLACRRRCLDG